MTFFPMTLFPMAFFPMTFFPKIFFPQSRQYTYYYISDDIWYVPLRGKFAQVSDVPIFWAWPNLNCKAQAW